MTKMSDVNFRRCHCTKNKGVCRRRVENGVRDSVESVTRALRLRLKEHVCSKRCQNISGLGRCGYDRDKVDGMSVTQLQQLKKIHHVKWEFIPGCIDTSDLLYHPKEKKRRRSADGRTQNIKYQLCFRPLGMTAKSLQCLQFRNILRLPERCVKKFGQDCAILYGLYSWFWSTTLEVSTVSVLADVRPNKAMEGPIGGLW